MIYFNISWSQFYASNFYAFLIELCLVCSVLCAMLNMQCSLCTCSVQCAHAVFIVHMQCSMCTCSVQCAHAVFIVHMQRFNVNMQFSMCICSVQCAHAVFDVHMQCSMFIYIIFPISLHTNLGPL